VRRVVRVVALAGVSVLVAASAGCGGSPAAPPAALDGDPATAGTASLTPSAPRTPGTVTLTPRPGAKRPAARPGTKAGARPATRPASAPLRPSGSWKRAFNEKAGSIGCEQSYAQLKASGTPRLTFGRTTVFVGFQQYGNNQDPVFARYDGTREVYCEHHEKQSPDGRALGFTWDGGRTAYVVYTVVGGGTELETKASRGWLNRYGDGGASAAVTVVGQVELGGGTLMRSTFLVARRIKNGQIKTNSIFPAAAPLRTASGKIAIVARSAFAPINPDQSLMCPSGSGEYPQPGPGRADKASYVGIFTASLGGLTCARTWGCSNVRRPCPDVP